MDSVLVAQGEERAKLRVNHAFSQQHSPTVAPAQHTAFALGTPAWQRTGHPRSGLTRSDWTRKIRYAHVELGVDSQIGMLHIRSEKVVARWSKAKQLWAERRFRQSAPCPRSSLPRPWRRRWPGCPSVRPVGHPGRPSPVPCRCPVQSCPWQPRMPRLLLLQLLKRRLWRRASGRNVGGAR